jgi:hypothetical protein
MNTSGHWDRGHEAHAPIFVPRRANKAPESVELGKREVNQLISPIRHEQWNAQDVTV